VITKLRLRRFKQFEDVTVELPSHVVLAGPNNCGKTTILQALAAWHLALTTWSDQAELRRFRGNVFQWIAIARQSFYAVPLRTFHGLWTDASYTGMIEIAVTVDSRHTIAMELRADSNEQIYVRPTRTTEESALNAVLLQDGPQVVFVPAMGHLSAEEPVYQRPKVEQLLGRGQPGEVIRNLLMEAVRGNAWSDLKSSIHRLFGYTLLTPDDSGPNITAEYERRPDGPHFDIASAGSGFQQVLMLLAFLYTRPGAVLLVDEPDAHLHVILQDLIFSELHAVAVRRSSQLIIATHSEVMIDAVDPSQVCLVSTQPRVLANRQERALLAGSMRIVTNVDLMLARTVAGVLFTEDYPDLEILRAWARVLRHPLADHLAGAREGLSSTILWKPLTTQHRPDAPGIGSADYFRALQLIRQDLKGVVLLDGDSRPEIQPTLITGVGLQRLRWTRYEIESYLFHPDALARYVDWKIGGATLIDDPEYGTGTGTSGTEINRQMLLTHLENNWPRAFLENPLQDAGFLIATKARTTLIPPALAAAGLPATDYTEYFEIAALMLPNEIHPEVTQKLNDIQRALGL
jgi:energy-coupling factor transporter ATP-binding protein EcfA2